MGPCSASLHRLRGVPPTAGQATFRTVAGFGFTFEYENDGLELVRGLLWHSQRQARYFGLELRYRINRDRWEYPMVPIGRP